MEDDRRLSGRLVTVSQPPPSNRKMWIGPRGHRIVRAGTWSLVAKAAAAANLFLSVPFVLDALGPAQFGAWATLVSLVVFAGFLDFGMGNGTMNLIASAHGRGASQEVGIVYRQGRRTLALIALALGFCVLLALPLVPWHRLLGLPPAMASASRTSAAAVLFAIVFAIPLNLATRVQLGLGRGDRAFRWQAVGQFLALGAVILLARAHASLPVLTAAAVAIPLLGPLGNTLLLLRDPINAFESREPEREHEISTQIKREGLLFFVLQLCAAVAFLVDLPLISALRGPEDAGTYAITQRLFSIIPLGLGLIWTPLWPIYRQALAAGNHEWAARTLKKSLLMATSAAVLAGLALCICFNRIVSIWIPDQSAISAALPIGFAAWSVVDAAGMALGTFLNAASIIRYQVLVACTFAMACLCAKIWAVMHFGIAAMPWTTTFTYAGISLLPTMLLGRRLIATAMSKKY